MPASGAILLRNMRPRSCDSRSPATCTLKVTSPLGVSIAIVSTGSAADDPAQAAKRMMGRKNCTARATNLCSPLHATLERKNAELGHPMRDVAVIAAPPRGFRQRMFHVIQIEHEQALVPCCFV